MIGRIVPRPLVLLLSVTLLSGLVARNGEAQSAEPKVDYNRDIRPILSDVCYTCHGPDQAQRKAGLRLDTRDGATAKLPSDDRAIVPGDSGSSTLYERISSDDSSFRMPPTKHSKQLTARQIGLLKRWIDEGAEFQGHWAFMAPQRPDVPVVESVAKVRNPIDSFVIARLEHEGLEPSPEADKETLIRRVTLDLTGLPPTIADIDAFLADKSPEAYEHVVDRLLASPQYGEHLARYWLDAARYGDTHGLHLDNVRSMWPYRDWVINALNSNQPFDQFTVEQIAGDLLPNPTRDQLVATGFNRCNVTTSEGGSIDEEYYVRYAVDRVETTATVWMGLTAGCAVCHDHKFDPISQKEFYQLFAFFNSLTEKAMDKHALAPPPFITLPTPSQTRQQTELKEQVASIRSRIDTQLANFEYHDPTPDYQQPKEHFEFVWVDDELPAGARMHTGGTGESNWQFVTRTAFEVLSGDKASTRTAKGMGQHFFDGVPVGLKVGKGDRLFAHVYLDPKHPPKEIMLQWHQGGWEHRAIWGEDLINWGTSGTASRQIVGPLPETGRWVRLEVEAAKVGLNPGTVLDGCAFTQFDGTVYWDKAGILTKTPQTGEVYDSLRQWELEQNPAKDTTIPKPVRDALAVAADKRNDEQKKLVQDYFVRHIYPPMQPAFEALNKQLAEAEKAIAKLDEEIPKSLVMEELPERKPAYVLIRGEYDKPGEPVQPGVPSAILPLAPREGGVPLNRLDLARWLVSPEHPLTARVIINRYWQHYFGIGFVETTADFGAQGDWPSHPRLLDWLATEFIRTGWNVKAMQRLIVTSATYRQSSKVSDALQQSDPQNRLLAHGPRFRLDAEVLRDISLSLSNSLIPHIGGPSVKPYQPPGIWEAVAYTGSNTAKFTQDHGEALYRRSLYTFWKRTAPHPVMSSFDAPSRESCVVRRARTNTPLQALILMNDPQFVEASRRLGQRLMLHGGETVEQRLDLLFRLATARHPRPEELATLSAAYARQLATFQADPEAAKKLLEVGESPRNPDLNASELAAWTMISNLVLNLSEAITKG